MGLWETVDRRNISIHAPREGCDTVPWNVAADQHAFQSTHPVRGATVARDSIALAKHRISIHAPREGCDRPLPAVLHDLPDFNPRTP